MHGHVWRIGLDSSPKSTKKELLAIIKKCKEQGYWLKRGEIDLSKELYSEGLIDFCCNKSAAIFKDKNKTKSYNPFKRKNVNNIVKKKKKCMVDLEGPYECPLCGGHFMIDVTFLDQVDNNIYCMYCKKRLTVNLEEN